MASTLMRVVLACPMMAEVRRSWPNNFWKNCHHWFSSSSRSLSSKHHGSLDWYRTIGGILLDGALTRTSCHDETGISTLSSSNLLTSVSQSYIFLNTLSFNIVLLHENYSKLQNPNSSNAPNSCQGFFVILILILIVS